MQLAKVRGVGVMLVEGDRLARLDADDLSAILHAPDPAARVRELRRDDFRNWDQVELLPPVDRQEVWAAGVTYKRSEEARKRESVGAAVFYDMVYTADRPELFFKASAWRVVGPGGPIRIRRDARWNVPEPELALFLSPAGQIVGYTIGNDVSSRDIEGENPLYLPQAKVYDGSRALGPVVTLAGHLPDPCGIRLRIERDGALVFAGETHVGMMKRPPEALADWLTRELTFPDGAVLFTGTGVVPGDDFTLARGDVVRIQIDGIGELVNAVG